MKFICENCKAKYQIGDDKIAGRSVRMKCRRCGHLIQLSASVTESSAVGDASGSDAVESAVVESASSASIAVSQLIGSWKMPDDQDEDGPTRAMTLEQRLAQGAGAAGLGAASAPSPAAPAAAPKPAVPAVTPRPAGVAPPAVARPAAAPAPSAAARPIAAAAARPAAATGMAGAFQKSVAASAAPESARPAAAGAPAAHVPHGEDWYVGIAGVPLGPVRLAVIREKALAGAVHADSLVWREGFDEWQPLKNFPELLEIVDEAQAARAAKRSSVLPPRMGAGPQAAAKPGGITAPIPGAPRAVAAAPFQPKVTAIGVGIPAVTVPAGARAPLASSATPAPPLASRPLGAPSTALPMAAPPPAAERPSSVGSMRSALTPPAPTSTGKSNPHLEATRPSGSILRPSDRATAAGVAAALSPMPAPAHEHAPTPLPSGDLFGLSGTPAPAPAPLPAAASAVGAFDHATSAPPSSVRATPAPVTTASAMAAPVAVGALDVMRDPFAAPSAAPASSRASQIPGRLSDAPLAPPSEPPASLLEERAPRRRGGMHPVAYAFIAMAAAFGGVVAFLMFSRPEQQPIIVVQGPGPATAGTPGSPSGAPGESAAVPSPTDVPSADPTATGPRPVGGGTGTGTVAGTAKTADPKASSSGTSAPIDTSGFGSAVPGPTATSTSTGPDPSLGVLSQGEISGVVASNQPRIRKRCWLPALDSAAAGVSQNARVRGRIVIGASGGVDSASASGAEKDFPTLASCIAGQMKGWRFPPSGGSTPVDVPFVFAGQ